MPMTGAVSRAWAIAVHAVTRSRGSAPMPAPSNPHLTPIEADLGHRLLHGLIAVVGWVLFCWWWWLVFRRLNLADVNATVWFVTISAVIIVGTTSLWAAHNLYLFLRKGPRTKVREVVADLSHDTLGRPILLPEDPTTIRSASIVVVRIEGGRKSYEPLDLERPRAAGEDGPA